MYKLANLLVLAITTLLTVENESAPIQTNILLPNKSNMVQAPIQLKSPVTLNQNVLPNYYNLMANQAQYQRPINQWYVPDQDLIPMLLQDEYGAGEGDYYEDQNEPKQENEISFGNPSYQPKGWFEGPMLADEPIGNVQNEFYDKDMEINNLMVNYFLDQLTKINKQKEEVKKFESSNSQGSYQITTPTTLTTTNPIKPTAKSLPKKLYSTQVDLFHRGQKEIPMLRPPVDTTSDSKNSANQFMQEWPSELDEQKLSEVK